MQIADIIQGVVDRTDWVGAGLSAPFYFHGTPLMVNNQLRHLDDSAKFPMIWLIEPVMQRRGNKFEAITKTSNVRLALLANANFKDWTTDQHYSTPIALMQSYADAFLDEIESDVGRFYQDEVSVEETAAVNWGVSSTNKGYVSHIIDDNASGVIARFNLNILTENCT